MHLKNFKKLYKITGLFVATCLFLMLTNPKHVPSAVLIIPFILIALILYQMAITVFRVVNDKNSAPESRPSVVRPRLIAGLAAAFPVLLLVLQSIGQLSIKDVVTVGAIVILAYFYMGKFSAKIQPS